MDYLPRKEAMLVQWSRNFSTLISADPAEYGLTEAQATAHQALHDAYIAAYQAAVDPDSRTPSKVRKKNDARTPLIQDTRRLVRIIQSAPTTTDELRTALDITVPDLEPTPVPAPNAAPKLVISSVIGRRVALRILDVASDHRGKPDGVFGASIFYCASEHEPPEVLNEWSLLTTTTRPYVNLTIPTTINPGAKVWLIACWINTKAQPGPTSAAISTRCSEHVALAA